MAYDETPRKPKEVREGAKNGYRGHDESINSAEASGKFGVRTDAGSQGVGYLGVDDLDRIRRRKLR